MTSDSGDIPTRSGAGAAQEPASERVEETSSDAPSSPYDIGLAADEDETGPKRLDTDLEDEQVKRDS